MKNLIKIDKTYSVLVVEDNQERIDWFSERLKDMVHLICKTPDEAVFAINNFGPFDLVFLDHDAVPVFFNNADPDSDTKTFRRVAKLLTQTGYTGTVIIHSFNRVGADLMAHWLRRSADVHIMMFGTFELVQE